MWTRKVNRKNLKRLCWKQRGMSVREFADSIGKGRVLLYRAVAEPASYPELYKLIERELHGSKQ